MRKFRLIATALISMFFSFGFIVPICYSQVEVVMIQPKYVKGEVKNVDFIGKTVTIRLIQDNGNSDEMTFKVNLHTQINKNDLRLTLSELSNGDQVAIQYEDDPMSFGPLIAEWININPKK